MGREIIASGLYAPEGPAVLPDGRMIFTQQLKGEISILEHEGPQQLAYTSGSPNSVAAGGDGRLYICQNGGVVGRWRSDDATAPGLQLVDAGGEISTITHIAGSALEAPNDLAFSQNGALCFTDPAQPFNLDDMRDAGYIYTTGGGGAEYRRSVGAVYCNGIAFDRQNRLYWVESYTRRVMRAEHDGSALEIAVLPEGHVPDGLAIAEDGRMFIAACGAHAIDVLSPSGELLDSILLDDAAYPSNLCFRSSELWVTDFGMDWAAEHSSGRLWRLDTDAVGIPPVYGALEV